MSLLKLFICVKDLGYNHKHNKVIPQSQGFQPAHSSSEVTEK